MNVSRPAPRTSFGVRLIIAAMAGLKLWLVAAQPIVAVGGAVYDDRLFLELADRILHGQWLGDYNQFTLMKGPMYPLWIAAVAVIDVPLPFAQHLLYLLGCGLLVRAVQPCLRAPWQIIALFALLWWQPMSYQMPVFGRVLRQNLYTPTTLLIFAGLCALLTRRTARRLVRLVWGALLGLSLGVLWLTREESIWIAPAAMLLITVGVWNSWRAGERWPRIFAPLLVAAGCAAAAIGSVASINYRYYGWFGTVEFRAPEFLAAYGALQRPVPTRPIAQVPVTREMRWRLYAVSPTFAELKPYLDGDIGKGWSAVSTSVIGLPAESGEIGGGWFMWALRDSVLASGRVRSAREALDFYARIADEINHACDEGLTGPVRPRRDTMVPPWRREHARQLSAALPGFLENLFLFRGFTAFATPSDGDDGLLKLFRDLTRSRLAHSRDAAEPAPPSRWLDDWRVSILQRIGKVFRWVCAAVAISGLVAWGLLGLRMARRRVPEPFLFFIATAALCSALAVLAINLLVHVLSFPNDGPGAFAQAYPLLVLFGATAWFGVTAQNSTATMRTPFAPPLP